MSGEVARPLLVGVGGSASAVDAVGWAAPEADRRHVGLRLVVAFGWMPVESGDDSMQLEPSSRDALRQTAEQHLDEAAAEAVALVPVLAWSGVGRTPRVIDARDERYSDSPFPDVAGRGLLKDTLNESGSTPINYTGGLVSPACPSTGLWVLTAPAAPAAGSL